MRGKFITFEGSEGSGKSTQIHLVRKYLRKKEKSVLLLREPGGVKISEKIRRILLDVKSKNMTDECETLLYMAARAQIVHEVILPALKKGKVVLCDRFLDSTICYQGYGNGVDLKMIKKIGEFVTQGLKPDLTFFFDIHTKTGLSRIKRKKDRIERRNIQYHNRVRAGYIKLAQKESGRIKMIRGDQTKQEIQQALKQHIDRLFGF